jgi:hypothetical protein
MVREYPVGINDRPFFIVATAEQFYSIRARESRAKLSTPHTKSLNFVSPGRKLEKDGERIGIKDRHFFIIATAEQFY